MKVEDNVELTDIAEVLVEVLHEEMDQLNSPRGTSRCSSSLSLISMHTAKYRP